MADIFQRTLQKATQTFDFSSRVTRATDWLRQTAAKTTSRSVNTERILSQKQLQTRATQGITIGSMYLFNYDPKWKNELPYYDRYPLIFPFDYAEGGFYGLNMHYLPPYYRARLMDALYTVADDRNQPSALQLSYQILKGSSKFKYFTPCVKHYLNSQVRSSFYYIKPEEWDVALFLPLQRFAKAGTGKVYSDSIKKAR